MEKPKVTGVQHVGLGVRDIEASRKFYRDVLECKIPMADFGVTHNGFHMLELYGVSKPRGGSIPFHVAGRGPASNPAQAVKAVGKGGRVRRTGKSRSTKYHPAG